MPPEEKFIEGTDAPGYDAILSKFHNPFEVPPLLERNGFTGIELHWYHHHPAMPYLEQGREQIFRDESMRLEKRGPDWRSYFLCSAFVVEAMRTEDPVG